MELFKKLTDKMKADKRFEIAVYALLAALGVGICLLTGINGGEKAASSSAAPATAPAQPDTEARLCEVLSKIRGAGAVDVMITYETGVELVPAMSADTQSSITTGSESTSENRVESSRPVTGSGGSEPIVLTERQPRVRGVIVVAEGAADISVRIDLQNAVRALLGVELDKVEIFEMKNKANGG